MFAAKLTNSDCVRDQPGLHGWMNERTKQTNELMNERTSERKHEPNELNERMNEGPCNRTLSSWLRYNDMIYDQWAGDSFSRLLPLLISLKSSFYRYLNYAMDPSKIGPRYLSYVLRYIADSNALGADVAWDFFQLNWEKISNMWVLL